MSQADSLVHSYSHLANLPRADHALQMLKKVISLVKPIMRGRNMVVRQVVEFYPDEPNLLGLNVNSGAKICLRLRYPRDKTTFLPYEEVVDTMLHELSHNVHGPHDSKFHALWNQLRDEHEALAMKGYTGEGFLSAGQRLGGGRRVPMEEARRLARAEAERRRAAAAEKRRKGALGLGLGHVLGGAAPRPDQDIRRTIADAATRRNMTPQHCGNDNKTQDEIRAIADTATRNGFRTQAEEDAANEAAIAQALWELVQEDEKAKLGSSYIAPDAHLSDDFPHGNNEARVAEATSAGVGVSNTWSCDVCTLENPATFLCCDACGAERGAKSSVAAVPARDPGEGSSRSKRPRGETIDLTNSSPPRRKPPKRMTTTYSSADQQPQAAAAAPPAPATWTCSFCGRVRERQWWSCDLCGTVKQSSA